MSKAYILPALISGMLLAGTAVQAQPLTDRFDDLFQRAAITNPNIRQDLQQLNADIAQRITEMQAHNAAVQGVAKTTASRGTIPMVFHIVLDSAQMNQLGNAQEVERRIKSQLEVLNANMNAWNADSASIPAPFKPLFRSLNVQFALAHTDPNGKYTKGYEIVYTNKSGFDENNLTTGSKFACSDVKFATSGGADAWNTKKYYNVWVTNILPQGIGGIGTPPPYAAYGGTQLLPFNEQGTTISFAAFGKKETPDQFFPAQAAVAGRTLVHESGHFFNLFHPFGISTFNNSNCQDDDGVTDTPPEAAPSQGKPNFPLTDVCSPGSPGVMWMNHMDYTDDTYRTMFTNEQVNRMAVEFEPGGYRYELLQHPELLNAPTGISEAERNNPVQIWPNPAAGYCNISTGNAGGTLEVINAMGQTVNKVVVARGETVRIDMANYTTGTYIVRLATAEGAYTTRLVRL